MATPIDIRADHLRIVHDVLRRHLPAGVKVWVFGSRATWATKDSSDLDLALEGDGEIPARSLAALESAFEDSDLPYAVDVVDVNRIGGRFRRIVEQQRVGLPHSDGRRSADRRNGPPAHWPDTWCGKTIEDIAASSPNAIVGGPFGSNLVSRDYVCDGVPVIRGQNMGARWVTGHFVFVTPEKAASLKVNLARPGDVVLTQRGTLGQVSIVPSTLPRCLVSQSQMKVTVDREVADPQFLYYVLSSAEQQAYVRQNAIQTGVPHTNLGILRSTPIPLPPVTEQRAIAHVLGTLDDKIELNRRMNATLEAMARALFRSWFVDFDPVRAKMEGRDTGLRKEIADLFPDRLVNSEVGEIPEGWPLVPLPGLMDLNPSRPLRKGDVAPYLDMANMPTLGHAPDSVVRRPFGSGMRFANGDTLVARITPCLENGKTAYVDFLRDGEIGWGSTEYIVMKPRRPLPSEFAYLLARTSRFREFAIQNMSGTSGRQRVSASSLSGFSMPSPPAAIGVEFGRPARLLLGRARAAVDERYVLANCRDTLLPRLISGEMRVGDAEKLVGSTA